MKLISTLKPLKIQLPARWLKPNFQSKTANSFNLSV